MRTPYTCLYREIWDDPKFYERSEIARLVYLYALSTTYGNGLGCFKVGKAAMTEESRLLPERFKEGFDECLANGLFKYDETVRVLLIPTYFERNPPANPNGIKALAKEFVKIPPSQLKAECYLTIAGWVAKRMESFSTCFSECFEKQSFNHSVNHSANCNENHLANSSGNNQDRSSPSPSPSPSLKDRSSGNDLEKEETSKTKVVKDKTSKSKKDLFDTCVRQVSTQVDVEHGWSPRVRAMVGTILECWDGNVAGGPIEVMAALDIVNKILPYLKPDEDGSEYLKQLRARWPDTQPIYHQGRLALHPYLVACFQRRQDTQKSSSSAPRRARKDLSKDPFGDEGNG